MVKKSKTADGQSSGLTNAVVTVDVVAVVVVVVVVVDVVVSQSTT